MSISSYERKGNPNLVCNKGADYMQLIKEWCYLHKFFYLLHIHLNISGIRIK